MKKSVSRFFNDMLVALIMILGMTSCTAQPPSCKIPQECTHLLEVQATAYTCHVQRSTHTRFPIGAWGDVLKPGTKAVAVSNDLIAMGLTHGTKITIEGLEGEYMVMDKMHPKWKKKIDVYMGADHRKAIIWGHKKVTIHWKTKAVPVTFAQK